MSRRAIVTSAGWFLLLAGALSLSVAAASRDTLPGDVDIITWLQGRPLPGESLSDAIRAITSTEIVVGEAGALVIILWLRGYRRQAVLLFVGLAVLAVLQPLTKEIVDRPRPDPAVVDIRAGFSSPSFPSGHVMSSTYLYTWLLYLSLALPLHRAAALLIALIALFVVVLTGPANVYLGVHWPSDVLGGWFWSFVLLVPLIACDIGLLARSKPLFP